MFTDAQEKALKADLNPKFVKKNKRGFDYVEGWHAIDEANRIFGFDGWTRETVETKCVAESERQLGKTPNAYQGYGVTYIAKVRITVLTPEGSSVIREGCGTGHGMDRDLGLAHESAIKEAETDAMKRALMTFGNQFGLALYDKEQNGVAEPDKPAKRELSEGYKLALNTMTLSKTEIELGGWAKKNKEAINSLTTSEQNDLRIAYGNHLKTLTREKEVA